MDSIYDDLLSDEEKDILQEIMNISFGNATADLSEVIDIQVELSVPEVRIIHAAMLPEFLCKMMKAYDRASILEQKFWGDFSGSGLLILPAAAAEELVLLLDDSELTIDHEIQSMATLEKELLLEIGNILMGACIGKIAGLLDTFVTYSPPMAISKPIDDFDAFVKDIGEIQTAIVMKTIFKFEPIHLSGSLLLLTNYESVDWLRKALNAFMEQYE
jgi:chemotaxis protein CheC